MKINSISINKNHLVFSKDTNASIANVPQNNTYGISKREKYLWYTGAGLVLSGLCVLYRRTSPEKYRKMLKTEIEYNSLKHYRPNLFKYMQFESLKDNENILSIDELSGLSKIKNFIDKRQLLLQNKENLEEHKIKSFSSILLWGVPGTGKTSAAMGIAKKLDADFVRLDKEIFDSEYISKGPRQLAECFREIKERAKQNPKKNIVVFMDEIDSTVSVDKGIEAKHDDIMVNTLKQGMTDLQKDCDNVLFIGATNKDPSGLKSDNKTVQLNSAILSRFNYRFEVEMPKPADIKDAWIKLSRTKSGKMKFNGSQLDAIADSFYKLKMSYREIQDINNKLSIEDAVESCKKKSYNSVHNLIDVLKADEKIGYDAVKQENMDPELKDRIISDLEKALQ